MSPTQPSAARWLSAALALLAAFTAGTYVGGEPHAPISEPATAMATEWTCSMHPSVRQPEPGACPICGMDLITAQSADAAGAHRVTLSPRARALAQLRTTEVVHQADAAAELRLLGRIEPAESTRRDVTTWIGGRIDRLHVNTTGERVQQGQTIATLYSPEVYTAHQDLITARAQVGRLEAGSPSSRAAADAALAAARERLRLLGVPNDELDALATAEQPVRSVPIRSPFAGTVIELHATQGAYVQTGALLYRVADLGTLWVQLDAYERDITRLALGQTVSLRVDALPGELFDGQIGFIEPTVDPQRRTARVRVVVDNPGGRLRPGLFAEAVVRTPADEGQSPLVIPDTAPLFTGRRSLVYVEVQTEHGPAYEPRTVRLGPRLGEVYPVVSGLSAGERVVSRGAFAVDADLQLRGGPSMMTRADDRTLEEPAAVTLSTEARDRLRPAVERYLDVQRALAEDDLTAATTAAAALGAALAGLTLSGEAEARWQPIARALREHAAQIHEATDLPRARGGFEPLSAAIEALLTQLGNPLDQPLHVAFCPMALGQDGARWVQAGTRIDNAYFGDAMRSCGEIYQAVEPRTHLLPDAEGSR
jgi:Cu(I)/Ag(I) efflux system membrane fusion protein